MGGILELKHDCKGPFDIIFILLTNALYVRLTLSMPYSSVDFYVNIFLVSLSRPVAGQDCFVYCADSYMQDIIVCAALTLICQYYTANTTQRILHYRYYLWCSSTRRILHYKYYSTNSTEQTLLNELYLTNTTQRTLLNEYYTTNTTLHIKS